MHRSPSPSLIVCAAAGYGKSDLLEAMRPDGGVVRSALDVLSAGWPAAAPWVAVDGVEQLGPDGVSRLAEVLTQHDDVEVVLASRTPVPAALRAGPGGRVRERTAEDLCLAPYAVARLLAEGYGVPDAEAALRVADLTAGWPALVQFAGEALSRDRHVDLTQALCAAGSPAAQWVRSQVLRTLPSGVADVLRAAAAVDREGPVTAGLLEALGVAGVPDEAADVVEHLTSIGVLVPRRRVGTDTELVLVPALADILGREAGPVPATVAAAVAAAHVRGEAWVPAARACAAAADRDAVMQLVGRRGQDMLRRGDAAAVARLVQGLADESPDDIAPPLRRTWAEALRMSGDPVGARRAFAPLVESAQASGWTVGLASGIAGLHYLCGQFDAALEALDRCPHPGPGCQDIDQAGAVDWLACRVHVLAMLGRVDEARSFAEQALTTSEVAGDPGLHAVAHLAMARTCRGTLKAAHHQEALRCAIAAGDAVTATRALAAQTCLLLADASYDKALDTAREAARMARLACPPGMQAAALHNLGEALARSGQPDEALWHLECSVAISRRIGPARAALGLVGIADVHRSLGRTERGRAAYTEALELARGSGDVQVLVSAMCGLALLAGPEPTVEAMQAVTEAVQIAPPDLLPAALTSAGRVAIARGDRSTASGYAERAVAAARQSRAADLLAEALELDAAVGDDPVRSREALTEALSIWSGGGAWPAAARVEVLIGRLPDADGTERSRARDGVRALRRLGIPAVGGRSLGGEVTEPEVSVTVLGPFSVTVAGTEVPLVAWRSRQARTLVKILAAQRGRVVTRARLCDLLWPDDDPARTGHRLSVLLATVRGVLDPTRAWPPDRFIVADQLGVRLDLSTVALDADLLLRDAAHATVLLDAGDAERAREVLSHVDALYRGEAFEDECDEWADALREETRAAWVRSVRRLATLRARQGRGAEALGIFVRLLSIDPYDEQVHRRLVTSLVRAGRHGEARRAFDRWSRAMAEIDAPEPDPRVIAPALDAAPDAVRSGVVLTSR